MNNQNNNQNRRQNPQGARQVSNRPNMQRPNVQGQNAQRPNAQRPSVQRPSAQRPSAQRQDAPRPVGNNTRPKKKASAFSIIIAVVLTALCIVGIIALIFSLDFNREKDDAAAEMFAYSICGKKSEYSKDSVYVNSLAYINFDDVASACDMVISGDAKERKYSADNQYVRFSDASNKAEINGGEYTLDGYARLIDGDVFVPYTFIRDMMRGVTISYDAENSAVTFEREELNSSTKEEPRYEDISFVGQKDSPAQNADGEISTGQAGDTVAVPVFKSDLSAYEEYMNPSDRDAFLLLVNKSVTLDKDYVPENLIDIVNTRTDRAKERMVATAEHALEAMYIEMAACGITDVSVTSGYRTYAKQEYLFNLYVSQEEAGGLSHEAAVAEVLTYSAQPGTSEHQSGLCCDMHNLPAADRAFADKDAYAWLKDNAHNFGFIVRFPEGKEDITGYSFEPWHYRFVGRYHATKMYESGQCLEEYLVSIGKAE